MNDKTINLENAFEYVRTFYNELAKMLADVIDLMSKEGWNAPVGSITDGLSYSLDYPDKWMCYYIYKYFKNKDISSHTKGIVIFFNEYMNDFPISIVCGKLKGSPESINKWGLYYLAVNNTDELERLTGEVHSLSTEQYGQSFTGDVFAIPLSEVQSPEDVKDKIVKKLLVL